MYKDINIDNKKDKNNEKECENKKDIDKEHIIIRLKRKRDEISIPSIFLKKSKTEIYNGYFYKYIDTICTQENEKKKKKLDYIELLLNNEELNINNDIFDIDKKRKHINLKNYEDDLEKTINNLKKYEVDKKNVQYVEIENKRKKICLIDLDLCNSQNTDIKENEYDSKNISNYYKYDLYILDKEKLQIDKYMDYLYDIKHENIDPSSIILIEDKYGNITEDYNQSSYTNSLDDADDSYKELSDYPDESSCNSIDNSSDSEKNYIHDRSNSDMYDMDNDNSFNEFDDDFFNDSNYTEVNFTDESNFIDDYSNDEHDLIIYDKIKIEKKKNYNKENEQINNENKHINNENKIFNKNDIIQNKFKDKMFKEYENYKENNIKYNSKIYTNYMKHNNKKKKKKFIEKEDSSIEEIEIKEELNKRLQKENKDITNVSLSDKLKILEQIENEFYEKKKNI